jgi:hypothetical protein
MGYTAVGTSVTGAAPPLWTGGVPSGPSGNLAWGTPPPTTSTPKPPATTTKSSGGGFWGAITDALKGGAAAYGAGLAAKGQQPQYAPQQYQPSFMQQYGTFVVIGAIGLVALVVIKKKK